MGETKPVHGARDEGGLNGKQIHLGGSGASAQLD